jgi:hypothetical protein
MFIDGQVAIAECIRSFDRLVPIGTEVTHNGVARKTWSHAGRGMRGTVVVWLDDNGPAVQLQELSIPGVEIVSQRRKSGESTGKRHGRVHKDCRTLYKE